LGIEARRFVRTQQNGVLSTISIRLEGYPFGSVAPYVTDMAGCPLILISSLAEHTRNIEADARVSLIVQPFSPDMQETARVTLVARAERVVEKQAIGARYLRHLPQARDFFAMDDFQFYRLNPVRIRYIGGFGRIHWLSPEAYRPETVPWETREAEVLAQARERHADLPEALCRRYLGGAVAGVELIGIDPDGLTLRVDASIRRIDFAEPVSEEAQVLQAIDRLLDDCQA
jgi:hypothetical protein